MSEIVTWKVLCYVVPDYKNRAAEELDVVIAAAEERGRRAGIEERDELRALATRFVEMAHHPSDCDPLEGECSCGLSNLLDDARAALASKKDVALAPRDSGKASK